jgi:recombination protein RecA
MEIIQKSGSWFSYQGERLGQGRENVKEYFRSNPEFFNQIDQQVRAAVLQKKADLTND